MEQIKRPWYKKKRYAIPLSLAAIATMASSGGSSTQNQVIVPIQQVPVQKVITPVSKPVPAAVAPTSVKSNQLSNDNYYRNVDGDQIHSPAYSEDDSVPAGASAQCRDGTYSFSANRRGTCSHHGGVAMWL
jgi:hypothetical protein